MRTHLAAQARSPPRRSRHLDLIAQELLEELDVAEVATTGEHQALEERGDELTEFQGP